MTTQLTNEQMKVLDQLVQERYKASSATTGIAPTGNNALFNTPGLNPLVPTTYVPPKGVEQFLERNGHVKSSTYMQEVYGIITGQTADSGSDPTTPCSDEAATPGSLKFCQQVWPFGEFTMNSKSIRMDNLGELINSASPIAEQLMNNPFATDVATQTVPMQVNEIFRSAIAKEMVELANGFGRRYARQIWTGNPANTVGTSGGTLQFNGLQRMVNTGYRDAISGTTCSAADSLVMDANNIIIQNNAGTVVRNFVEAYRSRLKLADDIQFGDVQYAWVMRYQLFLALTDIWPCAYLTYRCYTAAPSGSSATGFVDTSAQATLRDEMRRGMFLLIDGVQVPVIIDNTLDEANSGNGNFISDAYLLPLAGGGMGQLLYMEYFNYRNQYGLGGQLAGAFAGQNYKVSADGRFVTVMLAPNGFCQQIQMRTRKRVILRTPFLAARIDNLQYNVYVHEREWQPGTSFFENGGNTSFVGQQFQSPIA